MVKLKAVLNARKAYCNTEELAEYLYELNYCDVELDGERVVLSFDSAQLKRIFDEFYTLENFIRDAIAKCTEASEQFAYAVNLDDVVESVDVVFY